MNDYLSHNKKAWDRQVENNNRWTMPVSHEEIEEARKGNWRVILTPWLPVPHDWFGYIKGKDMLCLASAGGQQVPILAAAGAHVTSYDLSHKQLEQDKFTAYRERLNIITFEGDMSDLSTFEDECFDIIFHPVSNCFIPDVNKVWKEAYRVLRQGGCLLSGFANPLLYLFDESDPDKKVVLNVVNKIPYSDTESFSEEMKNKYIAEGYPFEFGHTLDDLIGGQIEAGFSIEGFYEDRHSDKDCPLYEHIKVFIATRAVKR
jgi:SAM-dependent methyltransferase